MAVTSGSLNGVASDEIPKGTVHKSESELLKALNAVSFKNFDTLSEVALHGAKGEPIDDKTYLMERIIQLTAELPLHDRLSDTMTNNFMSQLWGDLTHPPGSYLGYDYAFRQADGSNNNVQWPHIGQAGQPYARTVRAKRMQPPPPDPEVIFESVLKRPKGHFEPHPNKISSVLFYTASIIIHDCFHTSHSDYAISETSSYLDLSPLYGSDQKAQDSVRTKKDGKLHPDCFADPRIHGFPPGVAVMLIMFNRFHNMIVENLAKIDEGGRFSALLRQGGALSGLTRSNKDQKDKKQKTEADRAKDYDEALFQTGRLITCGLYINIVLGDYVRTILGLNRVDSLWNLDPRAEAGNALFGGKKVPEGTGNSCSAEFSLVYRWHSCVSQRDEAWTDKLLEEVNKVQVPVQGPAALRAKAVQWAENLKNQSPQNRPFENLKRQADGSYSDDELCKIWVESVDDKAGAFGAAHVPENLKFVEILSMMQARSWNLASLNEFREYFKLAPHKTFESINPDPKIAKSLERLYGHPDNVEIYPGIVVESAKMSMSPGSGLCASWTTSRAILADAVALVRGDRFYTLDYTPANLTNWGFEQASNDKNINWGGVFYKLVNNAFPNSLPKNSVYAHFPLVNPDENKKLLGAMGRADLYYWGGMASKEPAIAIKPASDTAKQALKQSSGWEWPWNWRWNVLNPPTEAQGKAVQKVSYAEAVLSNSKLDDITSKFYKSTLEKLLQEEQYELGGKQVVDIVGDVLNKAHAQFITTVLGVPLKKEDPETLLSTLGHLFEHAFGVSHDPKGLATPVRSFTHKIAEAIETVFHGSHEGEIGGPAFAKLKEANGSNAKQAIWQDVLPTTALILTVMVRSSASTVEQIIPSKKGEAQPAEVTIGIRSTNDEGAGKGQIVAISLTKEHESHGNCGSEIELAQRISSVSNAAVKELLSKIKGVERLPGPQGAIKRVAMANGDVKYLNALESEYVPYPTSLKIRWQK